MSCMKESERNTRRSASEPLQGAGMLLVTLSSLIVFLGMCIVVVRVVMG